jgi:hypothetical protein
MLRLRGKRMPLLLNNPDHWRLRAEEARLTASYLTDLVAKAAMITIADEYDRLASRAAERAIKDDPSSTRGGS